MTFEQHNQLVKDNIHNILLHDLEALLLQYNSHNFETIDTEGKPKRIYADMIDIVKAELKRRKG